MKKTLILFTILIFGFTFTSCDNPNIVRDIMKGLKVVVDLVFDAYISEAKTSDTFNDVIDDVEMVNSIIKEQVLYYLNAQNPEKVTLGKINQLLGLLNNLNIDIKLKIALQKIINYLFVEGLELPAKANEFIKSDSVKKINIFFQEVSKHIDYIIDSYKKPFTSNANKINNDKSFNIEWKYKK